MTGRRDSHPWLRLFGMAAVLAVVACGLDGIGHVIAWMSDAAWGSNP